MEHPAPTTGQRLIRRATSEDSALLTDITFRAKAYWGYSPSVMEEWRGIIRVPPELIRNNPVYLLEDSGRVCGYYSLGVCFLKGRRAKSRPAFPLLSRGKHLATRWVGAARLSLLGGPSGAPLTKPTLVRRLPSARLSLSARFAASLKLNASFALSRYQSPASSAIRTTSGANCPTTSTSSLCAAITASMRLYACGASSSPPPSNVTPRSRR